MNKYLKYWLKNTGLSLQADLSNRFSSLMFMIGKIFRFYFFFVFLFIIVGRNGELKGYNSTELLNFFLIFNLFDICGQFFFRGIYWFRYTIISGNFDLILVKPINSLFMILTDKTDFLDFPLLLIVLYLLIKQAAFFSWNNIFLFIVISVAAFLLITSIHVLVACLGLLTNEVDHAIWIYRDLASMARVPIDIYTGIIKPFLIYIIPIGVIFTFPAKALMGFLAWQWVVYSLFASCLLLFVSLKLWRFSLTKYSSASS